MWIGGLAIVAIGVFAAARKSPRDDLAPFRPYAASNQTRYFNSGGEPHQMTFLNAEHLSKSKIEQLAHSDFYMKHGWKFQYDAAPPPSISLYTGSAPESMDGRTIHINWTWNAPDPRQSAWMFEMNPLSEWDVWMLRLKLRTWNPFDRPRQFID